MSRGLFKPKNRTRVDYAGKARRTSTEERKADDPYKTLQKQIVEVHKCFPYSNPSSVWVLFKREIVQYNLRVRISYNYQTLEQNEGEETIKI